ncbi:MAG: hypothetical protein ACTSUN_03335 [Promethearchaeota archaeon]
MSYKIFDSLSYVPMEEVLGDLILSLPPQMAPYIKNVFGPRVVPLFGLDAEELYHIKMTLGKEELQLPIQPFLPKIKQFAMPLDKFIKQLDRMGVEKAVLFNLDEESPNGMKGLPNNYYAKIVNDHPEKFIEITGIDPLKSMIQMFILTLLHIFPNTLE